MIFCFVLVCLELDFVDNMKLSIILILVGCQEQEC